MIGVIAKNSIMKNHDISLSRVASQLLLNRSDVLQ